MARTGLFDPLAETATTSQIAWPTAIPSLSLLDVCGGDAFARHARYFLYWTGLDDLLGAAASMRLLGRGQLGKLPAVQGVSGSRSTLGGRQTEFIQSMIPALWSEDALF
jgi:hypothetical protein